ncbi:MAG: 4-(cytidine 5'-diphospho)-2-C-methyl-D-erythritol kinase [Proteobacteria bacterium]|nr:4-(cytidine 5'-diphospho)-2-C-methyl-D-erythritol kinase [Pseudomonadota bacterium]
MSERAPAKVNLTLRVLGRRPDGYHELESLVVFASPGDTVTLEPGNGVSLAIDGQRTRDLGPDDDNLVVRAARAAARAERQLRLGRFVLTKSLPVAAGLGGGSADAAAALRLIRQANPESAGAVDWHSLAASIGADVPVCLASRAAMMRGLGERIWPLAPLPPAWIVLANPGVPLATADVFRELRAAPLREAIVDAPPPSFHAFDDLVAWALARTNDLEAAAVSLCPDIRRVLDALAETPEARLVRMSGSGPTCFALYATRTAAEAAAALLSSGNPGWWTMTSQLS